MPPNDFGFVPDAEQQMDPNATLAKPVDSFGFVPDVPIPPGSDPSVTGGAIAPSGDGFNQWLAKPAFDMSNANIASVIPKSIANTAKSVLKAGVGIAQMPLNIPKVPGEFMGMVQDISGANQAKKASDAGIMQLEDLLAKKKAAGEDTTHLAMALDKIKGTYTMKGGEALLTGLGKGAYDVVATPGVQKAIKGDWEGALQSFAEDPAQALQYLMIGREAAFKVSPKAGAMFDATISNVSKPIMTIAEPLVSVAGKVLSKTGSMAGSMGRFAASQATGLFPKTIETISENPGAFSKANMGAVTRPSVAAVIKNELDTRIANLEDTGKSYGPIRQSGTSVKVDPQFLNNELQSKAGVTIDNTGKMTLEQYMGGKKPTQEPGTITTSGSAKIREARDVRALQSLHDTWQPIFERGQMTTNEFLNFRSDLAKIAKFERDLGKSTDLEGVSARIRASLNTNYRGQIPGLEEADANFSSQSGELKNMRKGILDRNGNLTDAAVNHIANATNKGRDIFLQKLEEISPGITKKVKILKAIEDIENASGHKVGTYMRSTVGPLGLGAGVVTGNVPLVIAAIGEMIAASPEVAVPLMRAYGMSKGLVGGVVGFLKSGISTVNALPEGAPSLRSAIPRSLKSAGEYMKENPPGLTIKDISKVPDDFRSVTTETNGMKLYSAESVFKKLKQTGSATIGEKPGMRLVIKDEGDFVHIGLDTGKLTSTDIKLPGKSFPTIEEAMVALMPLYKKALEIKSSPEQ